jgi:hypothetical protein
LKSLKIITGLKKSFFANIRFYLKIFKKDMKERAWKWEGRMSWIAGRELGSGNEEPSV